MTLSTLISVHRSLLLVYYINQQCIAEFNLLNDIVCVFLSKYFRTACFFGIFSAVMIIFFRYEEKNINNIATRYYASCFHVQDMLPDIVLFSLLDDFLQ